MNSIIHRILTGLSGLVLLSSVALAGADALQPVLVDRLAIGYLAVQTALADDDLGAAQHAAAQLVATAEHGPEFAALTTPASDLVQAEDIKAARAQFRIISMEMRGLVERVGTTGKVKLFAAHCPMAFGGQGGDWLQGDETVSNPYYGAMMLRCGSIKGPLTGETPAMPAPRGKSAHDHN